MLTPKREKIIILVTRLWMYDGTKFGSTRSRSRMTMAGSQALNSASARLPSAATGGAATAFRVRRPRSRSTGRVAIRRPSFR